MPRFDSPPARLRLTPGQVAGMIDEFHMFNPDLTVEDLWRECEFAAALGLAAIQVRLPLVATAATALSGTSVAVGTTLNFPHGTGGLESLVSEARLATEGGAREVCVVTATDPWRAGRHREISRDLSAVAKVTAPAGAMLKVLIHSAELTADQIATACRVGQDAGAGMIVGGGWFASGAASRAEMSLIRASIDPGVQVKPVGRIRTLNMLLSLYAEGVTRFNTVNSGRLVGDAESRFALGTLAAPTPTVLLQLA